MGMLHWAAEKGHGNFCKYLVSLNADPEAMDSQGRTAIDCADNKGHGDIVAILRDLQEEPQGGISLGLNLMPPRSTDSQRPTIRKSTTQGSMEATTSERRSLTNSEAERSAKATPEAYIK